MAQQCVLLLNHDNDTDDHDNDGTPTNNNKQSKNGKQKMKNMLLHHNNNVVFMGMGEPLDNWSAVHESCRGLTHQCLFGLSAKHVTISTVGVSPDGIRRMADEAPMIRLAVSLHGATQELRQTLMPATKTTTTTTRATIAATLSSSSSSTSSLTELEAAMDYHAAKTGGGGTLIESLLIQGVNDSPEAADALVEFCRRRTTNAATANAAQMATFLSVSRQQQQAPQYVNLIPYNPTLAGLANGYTTPTDEAIHAFRARLLAASLSSQAQQQPAIKVHVRWSSAASRDTNGACGQLVLNVMQQQQQQKDPETKE